MTTQFGRSISLVLANAKIAVDLSLMRIKFTVRQHDLQTPNSAVIRVYNLKKETAASITEGMQVTLSAGYQSDLGQIFTGQVIQSRRGRENAADGYLDIIAADGDTAYTWATVNTSIAAGSTYQDRLSAIAKPMADKGVTLGYVGDLPAGTLPRGKVLYGMARDHLRDMAQSTVSNWSIQSGNLNFYPKTGYVPGEAIVLSPDSGLIGIPEQTQDGIRATCLLNPALKVGGLVQIDSALINQIARNPSLTGDRDYENLASRNPVTSDGFYRALVVTQEGDTRGNDWKSDLICVAMNYGPTDALIAKGYG
jgi:hypothetical protein